MSARHRYDQALQTRMFPFLAVLFCTVGVLMLVIIASMVARAGTEAVARPEPVSVTSVNLSLLQLAPQYVECNADGLLALLPPDAEGFPVRLDADRIAAFARAFESELAWRGDSLRARDLGLLGDDPLARWLLGAYASRLTVAVMFLIRPDGIESFQAIVDVIEMLNELEVLAGVDPLRYGYDALPTDGRIVIAPGGHSAGFQVDPLQQRELPQPGEGTQSRPTRDGR